MERAPDGWKLDPGYGGVLRAWRTDGLVLAESMPPDPHADVLHWRVRVPRIYARHPVAHEVGGMTLGEVCAAADAAWPRLPPDAAQPRAGMTVFHEGVVYCVSVAICTNRPTHPRYGQQPVWRLVLVPFEDMQPARKVAVPIAREIPAPEWPFRYLIIDPLR